MMGDDGSGIFTLGEGVRRSPLDPPADEPRLCSFCGFNFTLFGDGAHPCPKPDCPEGDHAPDPPAEHGHECDDPICQAFERGWNKAIEWARAHPES